MLLWAKILLSSGLVSLVSAHCPCPGGHVPGGPRQEKRFEYPTRLDGSSDRRTGVRYPVRKTHSHCSQTSDPGSEPLNANLQYPTLLKPNLHRSNSDRQRNPGQVSGQRPAGGFTRGAFPVSVPAARPTPRPSGRPGKVMMPSNTQLAPSRTPQTADPYRSFPTSHQPYGSGQSHPSWYPRPASNPFAESWQPSGRHQPGNGPSLQYDSGLRWCPSADPSSFAARSPTYNPETPVAEPAAYPPGKDEPFQCLCFLSDQSQGSTS